MKTIYLNQTIKKITEKKYMTPPPPPPNKKDQIGLFCTPTINWEFLSCNYDQIISSWYHTYLTMTFSISPTVNFFLLKSGVVAKLC